MMTINERLEDVLTEVRVEDGRFEMSAGGDADVVIHTEDVTPLTAGEVHASIRVHGDDYSCSIDLDGDDVDALAAVLEALRGGER